MKRKDNIAIYDLGSIINKPKQLVDIHRIGFSKLHNQIFDTILHICQGKFFVDKVNFENVKDYYDHVFELPLRKFFKNCFGEDYEIKNPKHIESLINTMKELKFESVGDMKFSHMTVLPTFEIDEFSDTIKFQLNLEIMKALSRDDKIIGESNYGKKTSSYVSYDKDKVFAYGLKDSSRPLYEMMLANSYQLKKYPKNTINLEFSDFKARISLESNNEIYCRKKIEESIKDIMDKTSMVILHKYDYKFVKEEGLKRKIKKVDRIHLKIDFDNSMCNTDLFAEENPIPTIKEENPKAPTKPKSKTTTKYRQSILDKDKKELYKYLSNCGREEDMYEDLISTTDYKFYKECLKINGLNFASEKAFTEGLRYWDSERIIKSLTIETKELED